MEHIRRGSVLAALDFAVQLEQQKQQRQANVEGVRRASMAALPTPSETPVKMLPPPGALQA